MLEHLTITDLASSSIAESCRLGLIWALPEEQEKILLGAREKRSQQRLLGERASQQAMAAFSEAPEFSTVARGAGGEPLWPSPFTGSISHSKFLALAVVSNDTRVKSIGVDVQEMQSPRNEGVFARLFQAEELCWVTPSGRIDMERALMLFCLKESAYKAVFSFTSHRLKSSEVTFSATASGSFEVSFTPSALQQVSAKAKAATYQGYAAAMLSLF